MKYKFRNLNFLFLILIISCQAARDQEGSLQPEKKRLYELIHAARTGQDDLQLQWDHLKTTGQIPFTFNDSVYFLYKGEAKQVIWQGDFNSWGRDKDFNTKGSRVGNSDLWVLKASFPPTARLDYKIVVDDQWILDPANDHFQHTGAGGILPNSELRMPSYVQDSVSIKTPSSPGKTIVNNLIRSTSLGYTVAYKVHLPAGYDTLTNLPLLLLTDGQEFEHQNLGNITIIADNLIENGLIKPLIIVLIDPRNPDNLQMNRRMDELANNSKYAAFLVEDLLPVITNNYRASKKRENTGLGGVSLGGLNTAYVAQQYPEKIGKLVIMSPAFWFRPEIFTLWETTPNTDFNVFLSVGTINDGLVDTEKFHSYVINKEITNKYITVHQGHSWGNWRDLSDDMLIYLFGK